MSERTDPVTRKLYLSTLLGFRADGGVSGDELALASCFANSSLVGPIMAARGLVALPSTVPGGSVFCEDFNEQAQCPGTTTNVNACADNAAAGLPTASTICGNGTREALEECDNGAANGPAPAACSTACRFNN